MACLSVLMALVSECLQAMAHKYPLDFLHLIFALQVQTWIEAAPALARASPL